MTVPRTGKGNKCMVKSVQKLALISVVCLSFGTQAALAADELEPKLDKSNDMITAQFIKLDANKDGSIDEKEAKADANISKSFKKIAKSGKLGQAEYGKWVEQNPVTPKS